ncbi:MAG TPA: serine hydrolase domain-containing protein [Steroidobacteraceae bacterium]|nr:serine hydrolase domain-containing protein [Steroidobacteraceae bacterium]
MKRTTILRPLAAIAPALGLAFVLCTSIGAAAPARADAVDDYLVKERAARQIPGMAVAIVRQGRIERTLVYGSANLETNTPVTADSIFPIASTDKAITASGVMRAQELGKLRLDDPIQKYVDVPLPGVTLAMLLSHTSGIPDMAPALAQRYGSHGFQHYTTAELLDAVRGAALEAGPGEQYSYSDSGLLLAQLATQQAVGRPWYEFMQDEIFHPAGMLHVVNFDPHAIIPNRVSAYTFDEQQRLIRDDRTDVEFGELYNDIGMTVGDFAHFVIMLEGRGPVSAASVARMTTQTLLSDGTAAHEIYSFSGYGLGTGLDDLLGHPMWLHTGHSGVAWIRVPDLDIAVVVFTNLEHVKGSDAAGIAIGVAGLLEPKLSLRDLPPLPGKLPPAAQSLRQEYELFYAGTPDTRRYSRHARLTIWQARDTFEGRRPRLGALKDWQLVRHAPTDGQDSYLFRATHEHGEVYIRYSFDRDGRIDRVVWWHL